MKISGAVIVVFALFFTAVARADDESFAKAIAQLSDEDPATRDAGEAAILKAGEPALEMCLAALKMATDPEAKSRLSRICGVIGDRIKLKRLPEILKDQWFSWSSGDGSRGSIHLTSMLKESASAPVWHFVSTTIARGSKKDEPDKQESWELDCADDASFTVHVGRFRASETKAGAVKFEFDGNNVDVIDDVVSDRKVADIKNTLPNPDGLPRAAGHLTPVIAQRMSLLRVDSAEFLVWGLEVLIGIAETGQIRFIGEEQLTFQGNEVSVRHYRLTKHDDEGATTEDYWIEDARGVMKMTDGNLTASRTDEAGAKLK